jgi:hypothetical protein
MHLYVCSIPACDVMQFSLFLCVIVLDQLAVSNVLVPEHLLNPSQRHIADRIQNKHKCHVYLYFEFQDKNFSTNKISIPTA